MPRLPKYSPPTHPGEMLLEEFLKPAGLTQAEFARHLNWSLRRLNELIKGKRGVTSESALALQDALGMDAAFWLNLQMRWDLWHATQRHQAVTRHPRFSQEVA